MKKLLIAVVAALALASAANAQNLCGPTDCGDADPNTNGTACCPMADPANPPVPAPPNVITCGEVFVDDSTFVGGCIGSDAGANSISGCISVGGAVTTNDLLGEDPAACEADAAASCEACGCAIITGCP